MSRPPSARPKTSTGRAASAARRAAAAAPPDQAVGNVRDSDSSPGSLPTGERPPSRISVSRAGVPVMPPPPSRSGIESRIGTPQHRLGSSQQRIGSAKADRPSTGMARPPTAINPTIRPITQQGLSGGRAVSRLGTGSTRQVHDKSYYMGLLKAKANQLTAEIARLEEVYQKGLRDRDELEAYEQRAKESAMELKEMQGKLIDLNMIIDNVHSNRDISDVEAETRRIKESADEIEATVQELFNERQAREREAEELMAEIEEQKRLNEAVMAGMDPSIRERYEECKEKNEKLKAQIEEMQQEIDKLDEEIDQLELELSNSPLRREAAQLRQALMELNAKKAALIAEKESQETPEQKKQKLIEEMRTNNEDIQRMEKQLEKLNEEINNAREELQELDSATSETLAKNSERYRDLLLKEKEYDEFLNGFDEQKEALTRELDGYAENIVQILRNISLNLAQTDKEPNIADQDVEELLKGKETVEELQEVYMRLQQDMLLQEAMENRLNSEIETLEKKLAEMAEESKKFDDMDRLEEEAKEKAKKLEQRRAELEKEVPELEEHVQNQTKRLNELQEQLNSNPEYVAYKAQQKKLEMLREENARRRAEIEAREKETNYEPVKAEVRRLRKLYNDHLIAKLANK